MSSKRRRFSGELKAKVALEALRGDRTLQEIASQHQVHPNQVGAWKRQAMEGLVEVFSKGAERRVRDHEGEVRDLHAKIGELIVERDFLSRGPGRSGGVSRPERRAMIVRDHPALSLSRQCRLLSLGRSSLYYEPKGESAETLALMRRIDELFLKYPFYGARRMALHLRREGVCIGRRRAVRLMRLMGLQAIYRAPRTSAPHAEHRVWPYLLRGLAIERPNHVWCADITYIPVQRGFLYLVAVMDWASRFVLAWRLSNTLDASFCPFYRRARGSPGPAWQAGDLQHRPGQPVHQLCLHRAPAGARHPDLDGWQGPMHGQYLHRALVAFAQIRGDLPP